MAARLCLLKLSTYRQQNRIPNCPPRQHRSGPMVNLAMEDFRQEKITGRLLAYVGGQTWGSRVEIRFSKGGHYQFISLCPQCQWAKVFPRQRMAQQSLKKHLKFHKRRVDARCSKTPEKFLEVRKSVAASDETEWKLGAESSSSPLGNRAESPAIIHKENVQEAGGGHGNNRPRTASLYRPSAVP